MFHRANKDNNMGIHFAKQNRITSSNSLKVTYPLRIFQVILILFGVFGPIYGFISGLDIDVINNLVIAAILLSSFYYIFIFLFPRLLKYTLTATVILYFIAVYEFLDEIRNGFWHIENYCIYYINRYYNLKLYPFVVGKHDKEMVVSIFIIFVIMVFTGLASSVIVYNYFGGAYIILSAILIIFPLTLGLIPGKLPLALYLIFLICIIGMSKFTTRYSVSSIRKSHKKQWKRNVVLENKFRYIIGLKVGIVLSIMLTLLFLIVPLLFSTKSYEALNLGDKKTKLQNKLQNFSIEETTNKISTSDFIQWSPFSTSKSYGGLSGGELGKEGEVTFDNKTVLKVEMPASSSPVYLKGYVGSVYTGDRWESLSEEDESIYNELVESFRNNNFTVGNQSSYFLSLINKLDAKTYKELKFSENSMKVTNVRSNKKYSYAPYNTLFDTNTMNVLNPLYVSPNVENEIGSFEYYTNYSDILGFNENDEFIKCLSYYKAFTRDIQTGEHFNTLNQLMQYRESEMNYRNFVYSTYTKVSDKVPTRLIRDFGDDMYSQNGIRIEGKELKDYLVKVANFLEKNTSYSLKPGPLPKGKDYIEYFLYENKVGYCAHYASAATVMLRIMGVPARYVEGYIVKDSNILAGKEVGSVNEQIRGEEHEYSTSIKEVKVLDANAHAWVEVYIDGFGFVPVEFTVGYTPTTNGELNPAITNQIHPTNIPSTSSPIENNGENQSNVSPTVTLAPTKTPNNNETLGNDLDSTNSEGNGDIGDTINNGETSELAYGNPKFIYLMKFIMIIFRVIFVIVLFASVVVVRWFYITYTNKRKLKSNNTDKVVLLRYKELLRILSFYGFEINHALNYQIAAKEVEEKCKLLKEGELEEFMAIALKAKFGPNRISEEEAGKIELYYKECIDSMYSNSSFVVKLYIKYFKVFLLE